MPEFIGYEKILQDELNELLTTDKPIILFGTLAMGMMAKRTLEFLNISIACFCDNNKEKQGKDIDGVAVLSPIQAKKLYSEAIVYICSFNMDSIHMIEKQLKEIGFNNIKGKDMLFYVYQMQVMKRSIPSSELAKTMYIMKHREKRLVLNRVSFPITTKCSLKCRDCGALIPYFKEPSHYNKEVLLKSLKIISKSVDAIKEILIFGGEPFLHPDLAEICNEAASLTNVGQVLIITNGTIAPNMNVAKSLSKSVNYISLSDYGNLSKRKKKIKDIAKESNICLEITEQAREWSDFGELKPRNRTLTENKQLFSICSHRFDCHSIIDGEYHFCGRSAFGTALGAIPKNENDYVNLLDPNISISEIKEKLKVLLDDTKCITPCDYCDWVIAKKIPPAVQTKERLRF